MKNSSENFNKLFDAPSTIKVSTHVRVNLIGKHTDYTWGYIMLSPLPFKTNIFLNENFFKYKIIYKKVKHAVSENQRVLDAKKIIKEAILNNLVF